MWRNVEPYSKATMQATMTTQAGKMAEPESTQPEESFISSVISEIFGSFFNLFLVGVIIFLLYKIFKSYNEKPVSVPQEKPLPKLRKDFTIEELRPYDGTGPDGRILVAVNGKVFDVTRGKRYYGKDGPYAAFAGRDASRGLATFSVSCAKSEYDDLADLDSFQMESVHEWEIQFQEKYDLVGKLLKPGEQPTNYSDEEEEASAVETDKEKSKSE